MRRKNTFATLLSVLFSLLLASSATSAASFYVQLGSYKNPQNANIASADALGQLEQVAGPNGLTRIRIVGLDSKSAASDVLQNAQQSGFSDAFIGQSGARMNQQAQQSSSSGYIPAYSGPSDKRINAARSKLSPEQYGDIIYLDGKLYLKEGETFRPLE